MRLEVFVRGGPLGRALRTIFISLLAICFVCIPARSQSQCDNSGAAIPSNPNSGSFASNFLGPTAANYEIPISSTNGILAAGDLNATYFQFYYSILNAGAWNNPASGKPYCPFELVVVGSYPNGRYFSLIDYDMHYSPAQHLADFAIVPLLEPLRESLYPQHALCDRPGISRSHQFGIRSPTPAALRAGRRNRTGSLRHCRIGKREPPGCHATAFVPGLEHRRADCPPRDGDNRNGSAN